jgi:hypothetical protein
LLAEHRLVSGVIFGLAQQAAMVDVHHVEHRRGSGDMLGLGEHPVAIAVDHLDLVRRRHRGRPAQWLLREGHFRRSDHRIAVPRPAPSWKAMTASCPSPPDFRPPKRAGPRLVSQGRPNRLDNGEKAGFFRFISRSDRLVLNDASKSWPMRLVSHEQE